MRTLLPEPPPPEIEAVLERRRRMGADRFDEVWEGVLHIVPGPGDRHALIEGQLPRLLGPATDRAGLLLSGQFNIGSPDNVDEVLIVDSTMRQVHWRALRDGSYEPVQRSRLIDIGSAELAERIDWPATDAA